MGRKAVSPVRCVTHAKEPGALIEKGRGSPGVPGSILLHAAPCQRQNMAQRLGLIIQT